MARSLTSRSSRRTTGSEVDAAVRRGRTSRLSSTHLGPPTADLAIRNWTFRANWWRGLRAHSGHPTGSISASERAVRVRVPVLRLVLQIRIG